MRSKGDARAWLTLLRAPNIGAAALRALVAKHGNAATAVAASGADPKLPEAARSWLARPDEQRLDDDERWLIQANHHLLVFDSDDYPALLRNIPSAPAALFVVGDPVSLWLPQIAIVGARNASAVGLSNARAFAEAFTQTGFAVTSGLAEGIDGAAHAATLAAGGKTIAVLGTGIDLVYPRRHEELAARIAAENGALVSEFPPGTPGQPKFFPRRNRIISGLSLATLVVEASLRSGSLTTARYAAEQGREVFALPGSIHNPLARGCHRLIRDGARLVETAQEVFEDLHGISGALAEDLRVRLAAEGPVAPTRTVAAASISNPEHARVLAMLDDTPAPLDVLIERSGLPAPALSSMLLVLELDGAVVVENGRYSRTFG